MHRYSCIELLAPNLFRRPSADGQIGVEHAPLPGRELLGKTVRPAAITALSIRIVESFDRAVADGDVTLELRHPRDASPSPLRTACDNSSFP